MSLPQDLFNEGGFYWQAGDPITPEMRMILGDAFCDQLKEFEEYGPDTLIVERTHHGKRRTLLQIVDRTDTHP